NGVSESHLLAIRSAWVMREERDLQCCLEGCGVGTQDPLRTKGGGIQVAYDRVNGPVMRRDKRVAGHLDKSCCPQHPRVLVGGAARLWLCRHVAVCGIVACPVSDDLRDQALPRLPTAREAIASQDGYAASR